MLPLASTYTNLFQFDHLCLSNTDKLVLTSILCMCVSVDCYHPVTELLQMYVADQSMVLAQIQKSVWTFCNWSHYHKTEYVIPHKDTHGKSKHAFLSVPAVLALVHEDEFFLPSSISDPVLWLERDEDKKQWHCDLTFLTLNLEGPVLPISHILQGKKLPLASPIQTRLCMRLIQCVPLQHQFWGSGWGSLITKQLQSPPTRCMSLLHSAYSYLLTFMSHSS